MLVQKIRLLLLFASCTGLLHAQRPTSGDQNAVHQTIINLFDALSNRDTVSLKLSCTADIALYENGQVWNLDTLINKTIRLNTATDFTRINTINFISTTISKKTAWVTYHNQADFTMHGKQGNVKWLETVVLVKAKKRWKIKVLHSTVMN